MNGAGMLVVWAVVFAPPVLLAVAFFVGVVNPQLRAIRRRRREARMLRAQQEYADRQAAQLALADQWLASSPYRTAEAAARNPGAQRQHQE
jgi:hypothetical protein